MDFDGSSLLTSPYVHTNIKDIFEKKKHVKVNLKSLAVRSENMHAILKEMPKEMEP